MATESSELFVGPRPYEEKNARIFFGREREARDLLSLVIANPLLLIYAPSGAGKTSLINARLVPMLGNVKDPELVPLLGKGKGFDILPIARVSGLLPEGIDLNATPWANIHVFNTLVSWRKRETAAQLASDRRLAERSLIEKRLADYLEEARPAVADDDDDERDPPPPRVLIFDQFEELFTSHFERWEDREGFFEQVSDALKGGPVFLRYRDIRRPESLARRLADGDDAVSRYLRQRFSCSRVVDAVKASADLSREQLTVIVQELNQFISGENLYDQQRFAKVNLKAEALRLIKIDRKSKNFSDLNRRLLEDAYPDEIYPRARGDRALRVVFSMREDYIAELDPYLHMLPDRFGTRYRLERLRRAAALAAVTSPMQYTHLRFADGVAEQLVENLLKTPVRTTISEQEGIVDESPGAVQLKTTAERISYER